MTNLSYHFLTALSRNIMIAKLFREVAFTLMTPPILGVVLLYSKAYI